MDWFDAVYRALELSVIQYWYHGIGYTTRYGGVRFVLVGLSSLKDIYVVCPRLTGAFSNISLFIYPYPHGFARNIIPMRCQ